jgi:hypothetical protein
VTKLSDRGDRHTAEAKADTARREEEIVALRLRRHTFAEIGRKLGISKVSAVQGFNRALHGDANHDIKKNHVMELKDLELEQAAIWKNLVRAGNEENEKIQLQSYDRLNRVYIRRARLPGLELAQKLNQRILYRSADKEVSGEPTVLRRILQELSKEDQERFYEARKRAAALKLNATVTVPNGSDTGNAVALETPSDDA